MTSSYKVTSFFSPEDRDSKKTKTPDSVILHTRPTPLMMATEALFNNIAAELNNAKSNRPA